MDHGLHRGGKWMMKRYLLFYAVLTLALFFVTGCGLTRAKGYSGLGKSDEEIAVIEVKKDFSITNLNGREVYVSQRNWYIPPVAPGLGKTKAALLPGENVLRVSMDVPGWDGGPCYFKVQAEAGKTYLLTGEFSGAVSGQEGSYRATRGWEEKTVKIWLEEEGTQKVVSYDTVCRDE